MAEHNSQKPYLPDCRRHGLPDDRIVDASEEGEVCVIKIYIFYLIFTTFHWANASNFLRESKQKPPIGGFEIISAIFG